MLNWTKEFLDGLAKEKPGPHVFQTTDAPLVNAKNAKELLGIPVNLWMELTSTLRRNPGLGEENAFMAGFAVGWQEAKGTTPPPKTRP